MKKNTLILFALLSILILSCDNNENNNDSIIRFEGITEVNDGGISTGNTDETDWRLDDEWTEQEENIFINILNNKKTYSLKNSDEIKINPAYPNPCNDFVRLSFSFTEGTTLKIALVNQNLEVISYVSFDDYLNNTNITYDLSQLNLKNNTIYRFYYKFEQSDGSALKGHGDIKISQ